MAKWQVPSDVVEWIEKLASPLHGRLAWRLAPVFMGLLLARGRRTVASWLRGAEIGRDFRAYYYFLGSLGRKTREIGAQLMHLVVRTIGIGERIVLALDDSPTKRYGPLVEGAGIHHNPTPGPANQKFLYGHVWVTVALVARHPEWGTMSLPLLSQLYVRAKDVCKIAPWYRWKFKTKLELAAELVEWIASWLQFIKKQLWVVVDGGYVKSPFLRRVQATGAIIVGRLRKDANLRTVPPAQDSGKRQRGRPRKYGAEKISLAKRAAHRHGWQWGEVEIYGERVVKTFKTFLATYEPVGGLIRVVIVKEEHGWIAFFCTLPDAMVAEILGIVADRTSIEQTFHDIKEVHGAGQQQVRNVWANIAVYNLTLWMYTLIELWAWKKPHEDLCDRSRSPWDDLTRRPSHADRRNALRRHCIRTTFSACASVTPVPRKIRALVESLIAMAA
jgi:hypothetical protein